MPKVTLLFAGICALALAALLYFAQSAATQSAPAYSTWSSDPDGASLLFDGLEQAGFVRPERQFKSIELQPPKDATVLFLGTDAYDLNAQEDAFFDEMESSAKLGNDLVLAVPEDSTFTFKADEKPSILNKRWGIRFISEKNQFSSLPKIDSTNKNWQPLPQTTDAWQRRFGKGSIILVAKGQRLNNKGIATDAVNRQLLLELVSAHPIVVFEEAHLGIRESGSIVGLARHYRLQGLILGLLLLAVMFVWNRSVSFPPPAPAETTPLLVSDARSMLTGMLSRHLKNQLITTCVTEWNRTVGHRTPLTPPSEADAVSAYHRIQNSLETKSISTP